MSRCNNHLEIQDMLFFLEIWHDIQTCQMTISDWFILSHDMKITTKITKLGELFKVCLNLCRWSWIFKPCCTVFMRRYVVLCAWPSSQIQSSCLACTAFVYNAWAEFNERAVFGIKLNALSAEKRSRSLETEIFTLCLQILKLTVCLMCWPSKSAIQAVSNVETARKKATRVATASSVVRSGVMNVSVSIMASKQTKNTTRWRWETFKIETLRTC